MPSSRAIILAGGEFPPPDWLKSVYKPNDFVIAADRGALLAEAARIPIDILIGDFDSLPQGITFSASAPRQIKQFPPEKDYSDAELALMTASEQSIGEAIIVAALGGRLDHCLFNVIALLEKADRLGIKAALVSPECQVFQLAAGQRQQLEYPAGSWCSIISLESSSTVTMDGLLYSCTALTLERASTRGLSNAITDETKANITVLSGRILVIVSAASNAINLRNQWHCF